MGHDMQLFTIGFTQKKAETFFTKLKNAGVRRLIDIRLNNQSQLSGFAKKDDLRYFLREIGEIDYMHLPKLTPTQDMLDAYKKQKGAWETYERLGSPEGELALAQAVIYMASAPKSNAAYKAMGAAMRAAKETGSLAPPKHILNAPTRLMKDLGYSRGYEYDHDAEEAFSGQNYFPEEMARQEFYTPTDRGFEEKMRARLEYWRRLRNQRHEDS